MIISLVYEQFFVFGDVQKAREKKEEKLILERRTDSSELRAAS